MAGMIAERLAIFIDVNGAAAANEFKKAGTAADKELAKAEAAAQRTGAQFTRMGAGMVLAGGVMFAGLMKAVDAYSAAEKSQLKLQNTVEKMPELAGASAESLAQYGQELQKVTKFDGDATSEAMAMLGTFHQTEEQIKGMIPLVQDYAAKFGTDLTTASIQVGKALDGQVGALKRNGVSLDENLYKTDRYAAVTQALREQVGGFAQQEAATFSGQLAIMKNELGDVVESVGKGAVEGFRNLLGPITAVAGAVTSMNPALTEGAGKWATYGAAGLTAAGGLSVAIGQVIKAKENYGELAKTLKDAVGTAGGLKQIGENAMKIGLAAGAIGATVYGLNQLADAMAEGDHGVKSAERWAIALDELGKGREMGVVATDMGKVAENLKLTNSLLDNSMFSAGFGGFTVQRDIAEAREQLDSVDEALMAMDSESAATAFAQLSSAMQSAGIPIEDINEAFDGYVTKATDAAQVSGDVAEGQEGFEEAAEGTNKRLSEQKRLLDDVNGALDELYGRTLSAHEAKLDLSRVDNEIGQAQARLSEMYRDGTTSAYDLRDAEAGVYDLYEKKALLLAQVTAEEQGLAWAQLDGKQKAEFQAAALAQVAGQLAPGSPVRVGLEQFIGQLNAIPSEKTVTLQLKASTSAADTLLKLGNLALGTYGGPKASGGPVSSNKSYLVGEKGPELFTPGQGGNITPNHALAGVGAGGDVYLDGALVGKVLAPRMESQFKGSAQERL